jgi:hypothetical protein
VEVSEFRRLLHIGLGRTILYLQNHDSTPYRDVILEACLQNTCFDPQLEGDKTPYLLDILDLTGEIDFYREKILTTFASMPPGDSHDMNQFFYFARHFAERGDERARQLLYDKHKECEIAGRGGGGYYEIIKLDGINGFLFLLDPFNDRITLTDIAWAHEHLLANLEHEQGKDEVRRILIRSSKDKMRMQSFLNAVDAHRRKRKLNGKKRLKEQQDFASVPYEALRQSILDSNGKAMHSGWWYWMEASSEADLQKVAEDLLREENPQIMLAYVNLFRRRCFPLELTKLMYLAQQHDDQLEINRMAVFALNALENITHYDVRTLALKMIADNNRIGRAVGLLQRNFEDRDWELLESLTARELESEDYHSLGFSILDIFELYPSDKAFISFLNLYERCPCSECRRRFVQVLHLVNALPDSLLEECKFDSNFDLRELVENGFADVE